MKDWSNNDDTDGLSIIQFETIAKDSMLSSDKVFSFAVGSQESLAVAVLDGDIKGIAQDAHSIPVDSHGMATLRQRVATMARASMGVEIDENNITISHSSRQSIFTCLATILDKDDEFVVQRPYNVPVGIGSTIIGKEIVLDTSKTAFKITAEGLEKALSKRTKAIIMGNPNALTGSVYTREELEEIAQVAIERELIVISDETYSSFVYGNDRHISIASLPNMQERTIVVGDLSSVLGVKWCSIGFAASSTQIADKMSVVQRYIVGTPSIIAQYCISNMLGCDNIGGLIKERADEYNDRRLQIMDILDSMSMDYVIPSGGHHILVSIKAFVGKCVQDVELKSGIEFVKALLQETGVITVPSEIFGLDNYIMLSYAMTKTEIVEGTKALGKFISTLSSSAD